MGKAEGQIQSRIIKRLEERGWYVVKNIRTNKNGFPDLTISKLGYPTWYVEVKTVTGKLSPLQKYRIRELRRYGFKVRVWNR